MSTEQVKTFGNYKGLDVRGSWRQISKERLDTNLNIPSENDNELPIWMRLAKMLAESKREGTWGAAEKEALNWVRQISAADPNFLKGDAAVWVFYEKFLKGGKKGRTTLSKRQQEKVLKELNADVSIKEIAKKHDVSRGTIYRFIKNLNPNQVKQQAETHE